MAILERIVDFLFVKRADAARIEGMAPNALVLQLSPRLVSVTEPQTTALLPFTGDAAACIREAKYHRSAKAMALLAQALAAHLSNMEEDTALEVVLIPMPLSRRRMKERGFNQCEEVAKAALLTCSPTAITLDANLLFRTHDTKAQAREAGADRGKDLSFAFTVGSPLEKHRTYVLFDDVITTGATMRGAVQALREAGGLFILPLALSH